jgi:predicted dehydrogenase
LNQINVGVFGAGLLGIAHSLCLVNLKKAGIFDVNLAMVYDPDLAKAKGATEHIGFSKAAEDPTEIIEDEKIDTVFVCTPTIHHKKYVELSAAAKKNIFCEKPLYVNLDGAREMSEVVERSGVVGGVGLVLRYSPTYNYILDKIKNEDTGYPILISMRDDQCLPVRGIHDSPWRTDVEKSGGGTVIEHSIHDIDLFTRFFNRPKITDARLEYMTKRDGIEDYARVNFEFENGMEGLLTSIWHDMVKRPSNRRLEVIFEKLYIATDHDFLGSVEYTSGDGELSIVEPDTVLSDFLTKIGIAKTPFFDFFKGLDYGILGPYILEDYFFLKAMSTGGKYSPGFADGVLAHELVDEVYKISKHR